MRVIGNWVESGAGSAQKHELRAEEVHLMGAADPNVYAFPSVDRSAPD